MKVDIRVGRSPCEPFPEAAARDKMWIDFGESESANWLDSPVLTRRALIGTSGCGASPAPVGPSCPKLLVLGCQIRTGRSC